MKILNLIKNLKSKFLKNKQDIKKIIKIIELVTEKSFANWKYNEKIEKKEIKTIYKISKMVLQQNFPIQYIDNIINFYNTKLYLNPHCLIPRPETETIVLKIINYIIKKIKPNSKITLIDYGTGSGNIIISLTKELQKNYIIQPIAIDISFNALQTAQKNCLINNLQINLINYDKLNFIKNKKEEKLIIISNPPYLTKKEIKKELYFEPINALLTPHKIQFYNKILQEIKHLNNFILFLEIDKKALSNLIQYIKNLKFIIEYISRDIFLLTIYTEGNNNQKV